MHKKTFVDQASPRSAGELTAFCRNLSEFKGAVGKDREVRGTKGGSLGRAEERSSPYHQPIPGSATADHATLPNSMKPPKFIQTMTA